MLRSLAIRKTSLIDFPGRVAAVFFLPGCDFRCPYCHNAELVDLEDPPEGLTPLEEALAFLERRKGLLGGLVLSGGEPLLHPEAARIAAAARGLGLAVKLDTNGSFPGRIASVGADYVALDLKTSPGRYGLVAPGLEDSGRLVLESLGAIRASGVPFEIRITCAPGLVGPADAKAIAEVLEPGDRVYLQPFRPGGCLDPAWDGLEPLGPAEMAAILETIRAAAPLASIRGA